MEKAVFFFFLFFCFFFFVFVFFDNAVVRLRLFSPSSLK